MKFFVTLMERIPCKVVSDNPDEAILAPGANPIAVLFVIATVAVCPAPAVIALSPFKVSVGHAEEEAAEQMRMY